MGEINTYGKDTAGLLKVEADTLPPKPINTTHTQTLPEGLVTSNGIHFPSFKLPFLGKTMPIG